MLVITRGYPLDCPKDVRNLQINRDNYGVEKCDRCATAIGSSCEHYGYISFLSKPQKHPYTVP
jgi:hypothetical protein